MAIKKEKQKVYIEKLYCDQCGTEMKFGGMVLTSNPPQYPYFCPNCDHKYNSFGIQYPHIVYEIDD